MLSVTSGVRIIRCFHPCTKRPPQRTTPQPSTQRLLNKANLPDPPSLWVRLSLFPPLPAVKRSFQRKSEGLLQSAFKEGSQNSREPRQNRITNPTLNPVPSSQNRTSDKAKCFQRPIHYIGLSTPYSRFQGRWVMGCSRPLFQRHETQL